MSGMDERADLRDEMNDDVVDSTTHDGDSHATTGGAAAAGAVTGGVIGLAAGPLGAAVGAVGGAIIGVAAERVMHRDDDEERAEMGYDNDRDRNPMIESRDGELGTGTTLGTTGTTSNVESQPVNRAPTDQPMSGTSGSTFSDPLVEEDVTIVENSTKVRDD